MSQGGLVAPPPSLRCWLFFQNVWFIKQTCFTSNTQNLDVISRVLLWSMTAPRTQETQETQVDVETDCSCEQDDSYLTEQRHLVHRSTSYTPTYTNTPSTSPPSSPLCRPRLHSRLIGCHRSVGGSWTSSSAHCRAL